MKIDIIMPQMGESITEATISKWLKQEGDYIEKDQILLEISTDKVDTEVPSPESGRVGSLLFKAGDVVPVKTKITDIDTDAKGQAKGEEEQSAGKDTAAAPARSAAPEQDKMFEPRLITPLARSLADKHNISPHELQKLSEKGKVDKETILQFVKDKESSAASSVAESPRPSAAPSPAASSAPRPQSASSNTRSGDQVVPMDAMRQAIAEHMVRSKHTSPHVYSVQECDVSRISKWRARYKDQFKKQEGFSLSFTPFFLEATVKALQKFPIVNSSVDGKTIILKKAINLGCAVAVGDAQKGFGLIVPAIKNAEEKNLTGLARSLNDLALRARSKKLTPDEVSGGTFTVTNPGVFGTLIGTPIISQPQVAILCLGAITKRPVVIDDMIAIREMCYLTLSYDHRVVDGSISGSFLAEIRSHLEGWDMDRPLY